MTINEFYFWIQTHNIRYRAHVNDNKTMTGLEHKMLKKDYL